MNPLEARSKALETLMRLCDEGKPRTQLEAATSLLLHADIDPFESDILDSLVEDEED